MHVLSFQEVPKQSNVHQPVLMKRRAHALLSALRPMFGKKGEIAVFQFARLSVGSGILQPKREIYVFVLLPVTLPMSSPIYLVELAANATATAKPAQAPT